MVLVYQEFASDDILLEPVLVPAPLAAEGLSPEVAARLLENALAKVKRSARGSAVSSDSADAELASLSFEITLSSSLQRHDFAIPDSGLSVQSLVGAVRHAFGFPQRRIVAELMCPPTDCRFATASLRTWVSGSAGVDTKVAEPGVGLLKDAAINILELVDPFAAVVAQADYRPARAIDIANQIILSGDNEDRMWAYNAIGWVQARWRDYGAAARSFELATQNNPTFLLARKNLAWTHAVMAMDRKEHEQAYAEYQAIQALLPDGDDIFIASQMAQILGELHRSYEARKILEAAAALHPGNADVHYQLGRLALSALDEPGALDHFMAALAIDPGHASTIKALIDLHRVNATFEVDQLLAGAVGYPGEEEAYRNYAEILLRRGEFARALTQIEKALLLDPGNAFSLHVQAQIVAECDLSRGIELLHQVARIAKPNPSLSMTLGTAYKRAGKIDIARAYFDQVISLAPTGPLNDAAAKAKADLNNPSVPTDGDTTPDPRCAL